MWIFAHNALVYNSNNDSDADDDDDDAVYQFRRIIYTVVFKCDGIRESDVTCCSLALAVRYNGNKD